MTMSWCHMTPHSMPDYMLSRSQWGTHKQLSHRNTSREQWDPHMNRMCTPGTHTEAVTDHEQLIQVYNDPRRPKQLRIDRHRTKLFPFEYNVVLEPGRDTPCDYSSRHAPQLGTFTEDQKQQWVIESDVDIFVNRIIEDQLPQAVTPEMLKTTTAKGRVLQQIKDDIIKTKFCRNAVTKYKPIFYECSYINGVIMRGTQIIPESLQAEVIGLAHEGHMGAMKELSLLRQTCWFPKRSKLVNEYDQTCLPCSAAIPFTHPNHSSYICYLTDLSSGSMLTSKDQ